MDDLVEDNLHLLNSTGISKKLLQYGSLIYLSFTEETSKEFFACSEGFTKTKIRLKTKEDLSQEGNYMRALFKIYPSFYNNEYIKTKKKYEEQKNFLNLTSFEKRESRAELPKQIKAMEEETALNFEQYDKLKGTPIRYGQVIQLMHYNSNKYLIYDLNHVSDYESDNLRVGLRDEYSEESCFRILPCFSYQQEGQGYIFDGDMVNVVSTLDHSRKFLGEPFLHASRTKESERDRLGVKSKREKKEMNISTEKKSNWNEYIDEKRGFLSICDIIWINFSESSDRDDRDLNLIVQKHSEEKNASSNYFKFVGCETTEKYKKFVGHSNGLFIIESSDMSKGGLVQWDNFYRLRHLTSNLYLSMGETPTWETDEMQNDESSKTLILVDSLNEASLFKFDYIYSTISSKNKNILLQYLQKDSYFRLRARTSEKTDYWLKTEEVSSESILNKDQEESDLIIVPVFSTQKKEENIFKLAKALQNEVKMTCFLISCLRTIKGTFDYLKPEFIDSREVRFQNKYKSFLIRMSSLEKCLNDLNLFCHNKLIAYLFVDQVYGSINPFIQNVLREQLFIELLVTLLIISFPTFDSLKELEEYMIKREDEKKSENQKPMELNIPLLTQTKTLKKNEINKGIKEEFLSKKKKICSLVYRLLSSICHGNQSNQRKIANFLPIFAMQSRFIPGCYECILTIIKDFEELLMNLHKEQKNRIEEEEVIIGSFANGTSFKGKNDKKFTHTVSMLRLSKSGAKMGTLGRMTMSILANNKDPKESENKDLEYITFYNSIIVKFDEEDYTVREQWDLISFFTKLLFEKNIRIKDKKYLLRFLKTSSTVYDVGVNVNQETIYENLLEKRDKDEVYKKHVLYKMTSDDSHIYITSGEDNVKLEDFFNQISQQAFTKRDQANPNFFSHATKEITLVEKKNIKDREFYSQTQFICDQIDFYSNMCNSRNHTWKKLIEESFKYQALVENLDSKLGFDIRAKICKLLTKLYIDQEPRRIQTLPELCKVVLVNDKVTEANGALDSPYLMNQVYEKPSEREARKSGRDKADQVNINLIKGKIGKYIVAMTEEIKKLVKKFQDLMKKRKDQIPKDNMKDELNEYEMLLNQGAKNIFNQFTLEIIKLFKLILHFGDYDIKEVKNETEDFLPLMRHLIMVLEFDKTYPEARIFLDKRKEKLKKNEGKLNPKKMLGDLLAVVEKTKILNVFDMFSTDEAENKKKKKKSTATEITHDDMNLPESFLKQTDVLKQILNKVFSDIQDEIEYGIKLQICDTLNYYLDYKQDLLLSNLKNLFKNIVQSGDLYRKMAEKKIEDEELEKAFGDAIKDKIHEILPEVMSSGTSIDENETVLKEKGPLEHLNINTILGFDILPSLITLFCLTQNYEMEKKILHLMGRFYNQRHEFSRLSSNLLLLFDEINIQIFHTCKKKIKKLARYVDESEKWMKNLNDNKNMEILEKSVKIFTLLNSILYQGSTLINDDGDVFVPEEKKIDPIRQDLLQHLKAYKIAVALLKDTIYIVEEEGNPHINKFRDLFKIGLKFLLNFVYENPQNQLIMSEFLIVLLVHMGSNIGQVEVFCEIFRDNKKICLEKHSEITDDFLNIIRTNGRQAKFLDFFMIIQKVNNEYILSNQKNVLNLLFDPKIKNHVLYMKDSTSGGNATSKKQVFDFEARNYPDQANYIDEPYHYHAKLIELLAMTAVGKEGTFMNESKLRNQFNLRYVIDLLMIDDDLTAKKFDLINTNLIEEESPASRKVGFSYKNEKLEPSGIRLLKIPLLKFIYYIFLESEKISDEFNKYILDFLKFINKERIRLDELDSYRPEYLEYLFEHLLKILESFINIFLNDSSVEHKANEGTLGNSATVIEDFSKTLFKNLHKFQIKKPLHIQNLKNLSEYQDLKPEYKLPELLDSDKTPEVDSEAKKNNTLMYLMKTKKLNKDEIWKILWDKFIRQFLNSEILTDKIDAEKFVFAKAISKTDEIYEKEPVLLGLVNNVEIVKKLISFLQRNPNDEQYKEAFILVLGALGNYIEINELELDSDLEEQKRQEKLGEQKEIHQNFLNQHNAMFMILSHLSNRSVSPLLFIHLIDFGIKLLDGGNREVQKSVYHYFVNYTQSEYFFLQIHDKINNEIQNLRKDDNEFDEYLEGKSDYAFEKKSDEIQSILRLLQLFAEGHYLDLQNYMRFQSNNYHSFDIIQDIIELLNNYLTKKKSKYFENMMQCFDTLTEYIQGPCYENQVALIQGSFLDLASNLLSIDEIKEDFGREKQNVKLSSDNLSFQKQSSDEKRMARWMISRLKYKCSITLISLLEARKDNDIVLRMIKSLHIGVLKRNIIDIYSIYQELYKDEYTSDCFLHFKHEPKKKEDDKGKSEKYCSFIIETGFNLFILYSNFVEAKPISDEDQSLKKPGFKDELGDINADKNILQNNIVNKLGKMGFSILKDVTNQVKNTVQTMKNVIVKKDLKLSEEENYEVRVNQLENKRNELFNPAMAFFKKNTAHIEVLREDNNLEKAYFYIPPFCHALAMDDDTKKKFNQDVNRISVKSKVTCLLQKSGELIKIIKHEYKLRILFDKIKIISILSKNIMVFRDVAFLLAITINLLVLFSYKYEEVEKDKWVPVNNTSGNYITGLGITVIILSNIIVLYFMAKTAFLLVEKAWEGAKKDKLNISKYISRLLKTIFYLFSDFYILYYMIYGLTAIIGTAITPFFFAFHLFDILVRYPVLLNVLKSVWIPRKSLALTGFLFIVLMYVFTLFGYYWLEEDYPPGYCESTWICLVTAIDKSFKVDGGIGGYLNSVDVNSPVSRFLLRFFFDNIFQILIMIIMINILLGIIIDTFATLREDLKAYTHDLDNFCFICGYDRETLDKASETKNGFLNHIKQDHYMWNYVFYIAYIQEKEKTEYTGIESYVWDQLKKQEISWFPLFRALALKENSSVMEKQQIKLSLERIKDEQNQLKEIIKDLNIQIEILEGQIRSKSKKN